MSNKIKQTFEFIKKHKTLTVSVLLAIPVLIQSIRKIRHNHNPNHKAY
jgi:hypothetical protein